MSMAALLIGTRNKLRSELTSFYTTTDEKNNNCRVMPDEKAIPSAGKEFISIYGSGWSPADTSEVGIEEQYALTVAVTVRTGDIPHDRKGETAYVEASENTAYIAQWVSLEDRLREVMSLIHLNYDILTRANALITGDSEFHDPLRWTSSDAKPTHVGPDHFHIVRANATDVGMMMQAQFGLAARLQNMACFDQ